MATQGYSRHDLEEVRRGVGDLDHQVFPHDRDITRLLRKNDGDIKRATLQGIEEYLTLLMTGKQFAAGMETADRAALLSEARQVYRQLLERYDKEAQAASASDAGIGAVQTTPVYYPNLGVGGWRR
jgi:hypothetical protein